ncbi:MAG: chromosome segregation protein SMC [Candidatus Kapabacteria bacterium]|nr:chromosome segregation protein SMC [Candidatus Kapabacteria bacterium]MDW8011687.1 chromosome segregation protein SMC [Bacteroidota bacterium]
MVISRLELFGFKSFAHRAVFIFPNKGLTAIVGPNGCGKSNVVDAFRWVLGEQRLSVLRCESLEQLIFNGSRTLKPIGMAEVSLTVENTDGVLPVEFTQVVVTRRLYRSGDTEYRLNGAPCRLRDIQELFLDSGLAARSYSIMELRMVEELLNGRPEERRRLLDEAAGIGKYKARRQEAQRRLEQVQQDLQRVEEVLSEVRQQASALREQAEQARQWYYWTAERERAERLLLALQWQQLSKQVQEVEEELQARQSESEQLQAQAEAFRQQLCQQEERLEELRQLGRRLAEQQRQVGERLHQLRLRQVQTQERLRIAADATERLQREEARLRQEEAELQRRLVALQQQLETARRAAEEFQHRLEEAQQRVEAARRAFQQWQRELQPRRQQREEHRQHLLQLRVETERLQARQEALQQQLQQWLTELSALQQQCSVVEEELHQTEIQLQQQQEEYKRLVAQLGESQQQHQHLSICLESLRRQREQHRQELLIVAARRQWLVGLSQEHSLLRTLQAMMPEAEVSVLAEHIVVPEGLQKAVAAAIAALMELPVLHSARVEEVLQGLRDQAPQGELLLALPGVEDLHSTEVPPGAIGWLWQQLQLPSALTAALSRLVGRVLLVESLASGYAFLQQGKAEAVVTPDGLFLHRSGLLRWSDGSSRAPWLGRRQALEELESRERALQAELERFVAEEESLSRQLQDLAVDQLQAQSAEVERHIQRLQLRTEQLRQRLEELRQQQQRLQQRIEQAREGIATYERQHSAATERLRSVQQGLTVVEAELTEAAAAEERLRAAAESATREWQQLERQWHAAQYEHERIRQQLQELQRRGVALQQRLQQVEQELADGKQLQSRLQQEAEQLAHEQQSQEVELQQLQFRADAVSREQEELRHSVSMLRQRLEEVRRQAEACTAWIHAAELQQRQLRTQLQSVADLFWERFSADPSAEELPEPPPSVSRLQHQIRTAARQLEVLGAVNFRALQEYEQVAGRLQLLEQQYAELQQAARSLQQLLEETYRMALERLTSTLGLVRRNFQRLFRLLFAEEDEADLQLGEGDPLEAPLQIIARPRGKRLHSLEQLSSGEKALVAIALLFAIYLVKPSPFCVLDEIDAPLDDANIDRFLRLLRSFSDRTQFLLITHNKRTMEAVDTLYGVTMQPEGVSKVVAVRLPDPKVV